VRCAHGMTQIRPTGSRKDVAARFGKWRRDAPPRGRGGAALRTYGEGGARRAPRKTRARCYARPARRGARCDGALRPAQDVPTRSAAGRAARPLAVAECLARRRTERLARRVPGEGGAGSPAGATEICLGGGAARGCAGARRGRSQSHRAGANEPVCVALVEPGCEQRAGAAATTARTAWSGVSSGGTGRGGAARGVRVARRQAAQRTPGKWCEGLLVFVCPSAKWPEGTHFRCAGVTTRERLPKAKCWLVWCGTGGT
jgi:hypothetical protein